MAENYLGEFPVEFSDTPFADFTSTDWALYFIGSYGQIDGDHHKTWVIDQTARILKGTPVVVVAAKWGPSERYPNGLTEHRFWTGDPSPAYLEWVEEMRGDITCGECYTTLTTAPGDDTEGPKDWCSECEKRCDPEDTAREYGYSVGIAP